MDKRTRNRLRNMKWGRILVTYFIQLLEKNEANRLMLSIINRESDIVDNLIKELDKPFTNLSTNNPIDPQGKGGRKRFSVIRMHEENIMKKETRNINMIMTYLEHMKGFMEYCKFNHIYEDVRQTVCPFLKCERIKKGEYLFKYGEPSKAFYTLLKGKISIRVPRNPHSNDQGQSMVSGTDVVNAIKNEVIINPKPSKKNVIEGNSTGEEKREFKKKKADENHEDIKNKNHHLMNLHNNVTKKLTTYETFFKFGGYLIKKFFSIKEKEIEQYVLEEGKCFGDFGIIHNINRTASAYALDDCVLISINKELYEDYILKWAVKSENERKSFFKSKLDVFRATNNFHEYYIRTTLICPAKNQNIYIEGSSSSCIYLIYQGEFMLEKSYIEITDKNKTSSYIKKFTKPLNLMRLVQGAFGGLEILFNSKGSYDYTLKAIGNYNVIFQIDLDNFCEFKVEIKEFLQSFYAHQNEILKSLIEKKLSIKNFKNSIFENTKFKKATTEQKIQEFYKDLKTNGAKSKNELFTHNIQMQKKYVDLASRDKAFSCGKELQIPNTDRILNYKYADCNVTENNFYSSKLNASPFNANHTASNSINDKKSNGNDLSEYKSSNLDSNNLSKKASSKYFSEEEEQENKTNLFKDQGELMKEASSDKGTTAFSSEKTEKKAATEEDAVNKSFFLEQPLNTSNKKSIKLKSNLIIHSLHEHTKTPEKRNKKLNLISDIKKSNLKINSEILTEIDNYKDNSSKKVNFSTNIFNKINNSPERNLVTNYKNFTSNNPQNNIYYNSNNNSKNCNKCFNNNGSNNTSTSRTTNYFRTTFYTERENKTSSDFFKSKNNLPIISMAKNNKESLFEEKANFIYKKNINPIGQMYSSNVPSKLKMKVNYSNFRSFENITNKVTRENVNISKNISKDNNYENLDSQGNSVRKKSNLLQFDFKKYRIDYENKNIPSNNLNGNGIDAINSNSNRKSSSGLKKKIENINTLSNVKSKRKRKDLSEDVNRNNDNKNNNNNNVNLSSDPLVRTPIKNCLEKWNGMKNNSKSSKKSNFNLYRTSFFNIPLISMINEKKENGESEAKK